MFESKFVWFLIGYFVGAGIMVVWAAIVDSWTDSDDIQLEDRRKV